MDKPLTWFIRIWIGAVVLLNIVGIVGILFSAPSFIAGWSQIAEIYSPFNLWTLGLNLVLLSPALVAWWWRNHIRQGNKSFEDWLRLTQRIDRSELSAEQLAEWRDAYEEQRERGHQAETHHEMGLKRTAGDKVFVVAVREKQHLWYTVGIRISSADQYFVSMPYWVPGHDPHSSYHSSGQFHHKGHDRILHKQHWPRDKPTTVTRAATS